jgi:hypothetical protein
MSRLPAPAADLQAAPDSRPRAKSGWPVPVALIALSAIPLTAGTFRLLQLAGGPR